MQEIIYDGIKQQHLIDILNLYSATSTYDLLKNINNNTYPLEYQLLFESLSRGSEMNLSPNFINIVYDKINFNSNKKIIICFSGGKDSTAIILYYKKLGYQILLYHLRGINPSYPNEYERAEELAKYFNIPLIIEKISLKGKNDYLEHPLKNLVILAFTINYLINNKLFDYEIGFGNFLDDHEDISKFNIDWSDNQEMWDAFKKIFTLYYQNLILKCNLKDTKDTFNLIDNNLEILNKTQSCLSPYRFQNKLHNYNENKYNIKLLEHRCGSCWKCAVEYIYLTDHNNFSFNKEFYIHCLDILKKKIKEETTNHPKKITNDYAYNFYLKQPYTSSKLYQEELN